MTGLLSVSVRAGYLTGHRAEQPEPIRANTEWCSYVPAETEGWSSYLLSDGGSRATDDLNRSKYVVRYHESVI